MKIEWNKKYSTIACYAAIVIFCVVLCVFLILDFNKFLHYAKNFLSVFNPVFYGILITYLLSPLVGFFERKVFGFLDKKGRYRLRRVVSVLCALLVVLAVILLFLWRIVPQVFRGWADLQNMSGLYLETVKEWLLGLSEGGGILSGYIETITEYAVELLDRFYSSISTIVPDVTVVADSLLGIVMDIFLGIILAVYFLLVKERLIAQVKKAGRALLSRKRYAAVAKGANLADKNFGGFIKGQLADALIVGTLCLICTFIIGIPYYPLVSTIVGLACIVPVFGPVLGTVAGALIILLADPVQVIWFVLFMVVLHLVNKKMIRPRVIHSGVEASSVFMFTAIIVMTGLLGFWGLIIGVPVFAILYAVVYSLVDRRLAEKGLATDTYDYYSTDAGREMHREEEARRERRNKRNHPGSSNENVSHPRQVFTEDFPCITEEEIAAYEESKMGTAAADHSPDAEESFSKKDEEKAASSAQKK
ncbi:MAG: hypothetical protein DBY04_04625 [Clostridiales bacterium]|nr:MAG: hypothetical protein DBY04_04625 [Clostridiales bacterium]